MSELRPEPFFTGAGLDRADQLRGNEAEIRRIAELPAARQLKWQEGLPELDGAGRLVWEPVGDPKLFLGFDGNDPRFSGIENVTSDARSAFPVMALLDPSDAPLFAAALSLARWHSRHRFCANCGQGTAIVRGGWSRRCGDCGAEHFPRVDPVVIMLAEHDGKLLLGRQPQYPQGRYSALAGFVEVGENLEAAVARELYEEAGVKVHSVRYVASQPWPFPSSLMIGCHAEADGAELTIDTSELEDARWFSRDDVAAALEGRTGRRFEPPPETAIARTLLEHWLARLS